MGEPESRCAAAEPATVTTEATRWPEPASAPCWPEGAVVIARTAEPLLPVTEVASLWRCSVRHVYRIIAAGQLRVVQLGTGRAKTRVPESALAEYVQRNQRRAGAR